MTKIKIGGVPEYFNLPIYEAIEQKEFAAEGIDVQWTDVKEGTGAMASMLADDELDVAIILTEGITKSIVEGNPSRIIKNYVESPLIWGIHTPFGDNVSDLSDIKEKRIAISRYGSGSHLMSFLLAKRMNWSAVDFSFHVINNLQGAIKSFQNHETNIFLWEKYTTQPYVDSEKFNRTDQIATPWPCFVMAANQKALSEKRAEISRVCEIINTKCAVFQNHPKLGDIIANRFKLSLNDSRQIVKELRWSEKTEVCFASIDSVLQTLYELKLINEKVDSERVVAYL